MSSAFLPLRNVVSNQTVINTAALNLSSTAVALGLNATSSVAPNLSNGTWSTWSTAKSGMTNVNKVAMSSTGQYQLIVVSAIGASTLWLSSDSGSTWSQCTAYGLPSGTSNLYSAGSISADGQRITIGVQGDILYVSTDAGATFNNPQPGVTPYAWLRCENNTTDTMGNTVTVSPSAPTFSSTITPSSGFAFSMRLTNTVGSSATQYVNFNWTGATNFTISGWFNPQSLPGAYQIIYSAYNSYVAVGIDPTNKFFAIMPSGGGSNYVNLGVSSTALTLNTWYYFTYIFQANGLCSIYLNNTLLGTLVNTQGTGSITPTKFSVGCYDISLNTPFNGFVDDIRVTNSAITYQSVILPPRTWLKFENNTTDSMGISTVTPTGSITYVPGRVGSSAAVIANTAGGTASNYIRGTWSSPLSYVVTGWFNLQSYETGTSNQFIFSTGGSTGANAVLLYVAYTTNFLSLQIPNGVLINTSTVVALNKWYSFSIVIQPSGSTCSLYFNGNIYTGTATGTATPSGTFGLGTFDSGGTTSAFNGYIDDLRIYNLSTTPPSIPNSNWSQISLSGTGQYQLAGTEDGRVYQTTDFGRTWSYSTSASSTGLVKSLSLSHTGQYQMVNAQKWVSPNSTAASAATWFNNGVTWTATASSTYTGGAYPGYLLFNNSVGSRWVAAQATYDGAGTYVGNKTTSVLGGIGTISGEWIQLQSSSPLVLYSYSIGGGFNANTRLPKQYYIVGSNDGSTWYPIQYVSMVTNPFTQAGAIYNRTSNEFLVQFTGTQTIRADTTGSATTTAYSTSSTPFTYFRMVITSLYNGMDDTLDFGEWFTNFTAANTYTPQQPGLSVFTWDQNGVTYTASSSSNFAGSNFAYSAFNNLSTGSTWGSALLYDTTSGAYVAGGTTSTTIQSNIGATRGEWLQLQTSIPMILQTYSIGNWGVNTLPKTYYIVGSTDGTTWYPIQYMAFTTNPFTATFQSSTRILTNYTGTQYVFGNQQGVGTTTSYTTSATPYTYFRIIVTSLFASSTGVAEFSEFAPVFVAGQHYSTNYGSTWLPVPSTYLTAQSAISPSGQYQISLNNNPVTARLTMDGTFADSMGVLTGPTVTGAPTASTSVYRVGTASAYFENTAGSSTPANYLSYTLPSALSLPSALTTSCWIYMTALPSSNQCMPFSLNSATGANGAIFFIQPSGALAYNPITSTNGSGAQTITTNILSINTWYHLSYTFFQGSFVFYLNGMAIGSYSGTGTLAANPSGTALTTLVVGAMGSGWGAFAGYIDDVRLYPYALSAEQVYDLYRTPTSQSVLLTSTYLANLAITPNFTPFLSGNTAPLVDAATSYSGQYMVMINSATTGNNVWYSTNYGDSWTAVAVTVTAPLVTCAMSHDGSYVTVSSQTTTYRLNNNGSGFTLAVGAQAGQVSQGQNAIAIGNKAGQVNQTANSIVLNATGSAVTAAQSGFYVAPVATATSTSSINRISVLGYGDDSQIVKASTFTVNPSTNHVYSTGNIMIGPTTSVPNALLQFANTISNRMITLWENGNNEHQIYGFGINPNTLRYQVSGTGESHAFYAATSTTTSVELMRIQGNGYVGIGTTSPVTQLTVYGANPTYFRSNDATWTTCYSEWHDYANVGRLLVGADGYGLLNQQVGAGVIGTWTAKDLYFATNATTRMTITSSGFFGIGTTTPSSKLVVFGDTAFDGMNAVNFQCQASQYGRNILYMSGRYELGNDAWAFSMPRNGILFRTQSALNGAYTERWTIQNFGDQLGFLCAGKADAPAVVFDNAGNVGIGITNPSYKLHVIGAIYASGDISAFSDQRYKTNVQPLTSPLEAVSKLRGVSYHRVDDEPEKKRLGFLAQEVAEVYPEAVSYDANNDKYSVSYLSLVAPLVEAIKELKKELATTNQKYEAIAKWATAQGYTEAPL
jgi:hypothetical protein